MIETDGSRVTIRFIGHKGHRHGSPSRGRRRRCSVLWIKAKPVGRLIVPINGGLLTYLPRGRVHETKIGEILIVRLRGVLTAAEQQLVVTGREGRDLLQQLGSHLVKTARPAMEEMVEEVTEVKVLSSHHEISTMSDKELIAFPVIFPVLSTLSSRY